MQASVGRLVGAAIAAAIVFAASPAGAMVTFCNGFAHGIWVAIAYQQKDGSFMSRGWLELDPDECRPFDTALKLNAIWYRAETVSFKDAKGKKVRYSWGKDRKFAMWEDDNFNYWGAEKKVLNSTLELFAEGPTTADEAGLKVIITFKEGVVVTTLDTKDDDASSNKPSGGEH